MPVELSLTMRSVPVPHESLFSIVTGMKICHERLFAVGCCNLLFTFVVGISYTLE